MSLLGPGALAATLAAISSAQRVPASAQTDPSGEIPVRPPGAGLSGGPSDSDSESSEAAADILREHTDDPQAQVADTAVEHRGEGLRSLDEPRRPPPGLTAASHGGAGAASHPAAVAAAGEGWTIDDDSAASRAGTREAAGLPVHPAWLTGLHCAADVCLLVFAAWALYGAAVAGASDPLTAGAVDEVCSSAGFGCDGDLPGVLVDAVVSWSRVQLGSLGVMLALGAGVPAASSLCVTAIGV